MTASSVTTSSVANAPPVPDPVDATRQGFPADYFALLQECWSEDLKKRPVAEHAHRRLLLLDPSDRAAQGVMRTVFRGLDVPVTQLSHQCPPPTLATNPRLRMNIALVQVRRERQHLVDVNYINRDRQVQNTFAV